ncbi:hypothetical protein [Dactylosporangium sp. CA-139066]|uniref:hypothetical protein n=1 Tax=Dactylosporangium sp. CA-139066 TaxID=3239930 RepID=UPI003D905DFB
MPPDWYAVAPYRFPLTEQPVVLRLPAAGPAPFNSLVVVRGRIHLTAPSVSDGSLRRFRLTVRTPFTLGGFEAGTAPSYRDSSAVALGMLQCSDRTPFTVAVDGVRGAFDDEGRWTLAVEARGSWSGVLAAASGYYSSWILCRETAPTS